MGRRTEILSLEGRIIGMSLLAIALGTGAPFLFLYWGADNWLAWCGGLLFSVLTVITLLRPLTRSITRGLDALHSGLLNFRDGDFSISLALPQKNQLGELAQLYNEVGEILRRERAHIHQRELLLDTVIQSSPLSLLLLDQNQHIIYANTSARHLLYKGKPLQGHTLQKILPDFPPELARAIEIQQDGLFSYLQDDHSQTLHVSNSEFVLNAQKHRLILLKEMTRDLTRAEVQVWKKVIRLISHELNNSLAPISSMAHSGKAISQQSSQAEPLAKVFDVIADRCRHLTEFTQGYARFAKLPAPSRTEVNWRQLIEHLQALQVFSLDGELPARPGYFDPIQIEQALLNLLKNSAEASLPEPGESKLEISDNEYKNENQIHLKIRTDAHGQLISVMDRGSGMSDKVLQQALLPFYSTKPQGVGLGLALCREIVDAHEGKIQLHNRSGGGLLVDIWLPWPKTGDSI